MKTPLNYQLPEIEDLRRIIKAIVVLDCILVPERDCRHHTYKTDPITGDEVACIKCKEDHEFQIMFNQQGAVISSTAPFTLSDFYDSINLPYKNILEGFLGKQRILNYLDEIRKGIVGNIPQVFLNFICDAERESNYYFWRKTNSLNWNLGFPQDLVLNSSKNRNHLSILQDNPAHFKHWAERQYREDLQGKEIPLESVRAIYNEENINLRLLKTISDDVNLFRIVEDLEYIGYAKCG